MMKVAGVRVVNFKSFADSGDVPLGQVNVLVGRNNHGKSAFIRAVHLMQQGAIVSSNDVRLNEQQGGVSMVLTGKPEELQYYYDVPDDITSLPISFLLSLSGGLVFQTSPGVGRNWSPKQLPAQEPKNFIYTYLSKRKVYEFDREVDLNRTRAVLPNLSYLVSKVARLSNPDYIHAAEYDELCKALLGFRISVHAAEDGRGQQAGIPVGWFGHIPIESMGEGVSSQLGLITDLCMADGNLFLIEEPENDIHPEGLKTLLNVIVEKSATNQFIVSTHSNIVTRYLGAAPDSKVFEFESDYKPNQIPTSTIREVEPTVEARIDVLRRLGYELSDFDLWDGWLILEESSAEVVIRYLIPWFVPELSRVRTVAAGGTSKVEPTFEDFRRLFLFTHLEPQYRGRAWVMVDGDDTGQQVVADLRAKYKDWPPNHFATWSQPDFERYYPSRFADQAEAALAKPQREKRAAKKKLLDEVKAWCNANPGEARVEFGKSGAEIIGKLKEIDQTLRGGSGEQIRTPGCTLLTRTPDRPTGHDLQ